MSRILLVEDSPTQAAATSVLLQDAGFEVVEAASGERALSILETTSIDLLLTDLTLPGLTGIELCRQVKNQPHTQSIPVVVLTGSGDVANVLRGLEAGASAYASKVREPEQLLSVIRHALSSRSRSQPVSHESVSFRGETFDLHVTAERLITVMLSAFEDLSDLNDRHEYLNRQLEQELKQRERAEKSLRDSEAIYHSLVENVPVSLFRKDAEGQFTFGNQPFCRELGVTPEELIGKTDHDFFPAELADKYRANDQHVMQNGEVFEDVEAHRTPDGKQLFVQVLKAPVRDADGLVTGVQVVFWDVTDRELAQQHLKDSEARKQAIFESSLDCMILSDHEGNIVEFNRAAERTFGYSRSDVLGTPLDSLFTLSDRARENLDRYSSRGEEGSMLGKRQETPLRRKDGSMFMAEVAVQPIPLGDSVQFATVLHDITRRKEHERELQQARAAAETANHAKSEFLANMSHEIRTPMNAIIGMTELVLGTALTAEQRQHLLIVQDSADSLLDLINDILDFSKIEAGKLELDLQPFAVRDRIGDTMKSLAIRAHQKDLELAFHVSPEVPEAIVGDSGRLRQVLVNLAGNAIKFTATGEVVLDVAVKSRDVRSVVLTFSVRDTGIGIPEKQQRAIFNAFEQADTSTTRKFGGTGLGLAISSRLVQLMGGEIDVESALGQGSTFSFSAGFPVAAPESVSHRSRIPRSVQELDVLVVDDNQTNLTILKEMLTGWGLKPLCVSTGAQALQELQQQHAAKKPFGLLITDVNMPQMDGFQLVTAIRNSVSLHDVKVVVLTSADRPGDVDQCRELSVDRYMTKPVKQSELLTAIEHIAGVDPELPALTDAAEDEEPVEPLKILLAEDSKTNQILALALLGQQGHSVEVAGTGKEAVERNSADDFDLILMDVQMPEMDGLEATRRIRQQERSTGHHTPIIAMTANAMKGDREKCLESGMDDYVSKPIRTDELFAALARVQASGGVTQNPPSKPLRSTDATAFIESSVEVNTDAESLVDWDAALSTVNGHQSILDSVIEAVLEECPRLLEQLGRAICERDAKVVQRAAHTIKGTMRTFNVATVIDVAQRIEESGAAEKLDDVSSLFDQLGPMLNRVLDEMRDREIQYEGDSSSDSIFDD